MLWDPHKKNVSAPVDCTDEVKRCGEELGWRKSAADSRRSRRGSAAINQHPSGEAKGGRRQFWLGLLWCNCGSPTSNKQG